MFSVQEMNVNLTHVKSSIIPIRVWFSLWKVPIRPSVAL